MTDPIRTPDEALEAAMQAVFEYSEHKADVAHIPALMDAHAAIRALASRIAAPDDETLVDMLRAKNAEVHLCDMPCDLSDCGCRRDAELAVKALREAGALR